MKHTDIYLNGFESGLHGLTPEDENGLVIIQR